MITVENGSYPYYDESLLNEVSPSLRVYRTKTFEPFELYNLIRGKKGKTMPVVSVGSHQKRTVFQRVSEYIRANYFIPDARKGWVPYAVKQAENILKHEKIDAIITTGPPHSAHLIGLRLKQKYGLKWIADLRDPWTQIFYNRLLPRTESSRKKDHDLETEVLKTADRVTVISPGMKNQFNQFKQKIDVIYNGYDEEDFIVPNIPEIKEDKFIIRYVGNLMASQNVEKFWEALSDLRKGNFDFEIEFIGRVDADVKDSIAKYDLADVAVYRDFMDHKMAIHLMVEASLLLFIIPAVEDNKLIMTGKLFEYIASGSEIIAIGPVDGDANEVLKMAERKPMVDYGDRVSLVQQLNEIKGQWTANHKSVKYSTAHFSNFSRQKQAGSLAHILEAI
ncbi:MAG: hypothetical protein JWO06_2740 [Bacteroidota bacterium]|nr:hypothetical protein [Bacteroidota bacterium]